MQQRNAELVQMSSKDPRSFWKVYTPRKREACPVSPDKQTEAFQQLYGAQPNEPAQTAVTPSVSTLDPDVDECMSASITADELHDCIKKLQRGKSPGIDGVCA